MADEPGKTPPNETRTGIMLLLAPVINAALIQAGLDMGREDLQRRFFRALIHLAVGRLLDAGAPPEFLVAQTVEAVNHELEKRAVESPANAGMNPMKPTTVN